jgi:hypothetical protein
MAKKKPYRSTVSLKRKISKYSIYCSLKGFPRDVHQNLGTLRKAVLVINYLLFFYFPEDVLRSKY